MGLPRPNRLWALGLLPFLALALLRLQDGASAEHGDYAQYLLHARAVTEGKAYEDTGYLYTELNPVIGPVAYPPGLPLVLVPVVATAGDPRSLARPLMLLFALGFLVFAAVYFARRDSVRAGWLVAILAGLSLPFLQWSTRLGTDIPFCALVWLTILLMDRPERPGRGSAVLLMLAGAAAIAFRSAGIALIPAALLYLLLNRRRGARIVLGCVALWTAVFVASAVLLPTASSYADQIPRSPGKIVSYFLGGVLDYRHAFSDAVLGAWLPDVAAKAWRGGALVLAVIGLSAWLRSEWRSFLACFAFFYAGVVLAFPAHMTRYIWPLYPLLLYGVLRGLASVLALGFRGRNTPRWIHAVPAATVLVLVAGQAWLALRAPRVSDLGEEPGVQALLDHLRAGTDADGRRVVFFKPRVLVWETRLPAMGLVVAPPDAWIEELCRQGITDVVTGNLGAAPEGDTSLQHAIAAHPERFQQTWSEGAFVLYRFDRGACAAQGADR